MKKKPSRRTQEERRQTTQSAILKAAIDLLVEQGFSRFSTIAVARRAKVSRGARENYYRTKYDLIAAAWRAALIRSENHAKLLARPGPSNFLDRFLEDSMSFFLSRDYMAMLELSMAARTDKKLSRIFHALYKPHRKSHDDIWIDTLVRQGYSRSSVHTFVDMTNYLLRGFALTSVWDKRKQPFNSALREWRAIAPLCLKR